MQSSQQQLELQTQKHNLQTSLALAFERTSTEPYNIENMVNDILTEFPKLSNDDFTKAIRNGSLGVYGRVYKLSTSEVCFWIREFMNNKNSKLRL